MKRVLFRASKAPTDHMFNGAIPKASFLAVHGALEQVETKNAGNLLFAHAAYKTISTPGRHIDVDRYESCQSETFADNADFINENYDAFVIPLCNSFREDFRLGLVRLTRLIKKLKIPVVVPGVGAQLSLDAMGNESTPIDLEVKGFVSSVLDRCTSIGVRGDTTRRYLIKLGFPSRLVDVIGCPSMFYNGENMEVSKPVHLGAVSLNLTTILDPQIYNFTRWFNSNHEKVTYIPQVRRLLAVLGCGYAPPSNEIPSLRFPAPALIHPDRIAFFYDIVPWIDFLKTQSFAIGTRIHGNIIALLAGTAAHVIAHDSRTLEMARYFEIPHTKLNEVGNFDIRRTYEESDYSLLIANHSARLRIYANFLEKSGVRHILYDKKQLRDYDVRLRATLSSARLPTIKSRTRMGHFESRAKRAYRYGKASIHRLAGHVPY